MDNEKTPVEKAEEALWDYINSLPPEEREQAIEYQRGLEAEAAVTEGGMPEVLRKRLKHNTMLLQETIDELSEIVGERAAQAVIAKYRS